MNGNSGSRITRFMSGLMKLKVYEKYEVEERESKN